MGSLRMDSTQTITTVCVNGLEKAKGNPQINGDDVQIPCEEAINQGSDDGTGSKNKDFSWVSVFSSQAEGC